MKIVEHIVSLSVLLMCLTACVRVEEHGYDSTRPIEFANPVLKSSVRAVIDGPTYPENLKFRVFAKWNKEEFTTWNSPESIFYMESVVISRQTDGKWISDSPYYWPVEGGLTFAAYSPAGLPGVSYDSEGLVIENHTVANTEKAIKNPKDILYSERKYNQTSLSNPVDIVFKHALSRIQFKIVADDANVTLKSLKIKNICTTGDFCENIFEDKANPSVYKINTKARMWTVVKNADNSEKIADYVLIFPTTSIPQQNPGHTVEPLISSPMLVLPQRFGKSEGPQGGLIDASNAYFELKYEKNGTVYTSDATITKIENFTPVWEPGKNYIYTVTIGNNKINFKAGSIDGWGSGNGDIGESI